MNEYGYRYGTSSLRWARLDEVYSNLTQNVLDHIEKGTLGTLRSRHVGIKLDVTVGVRVNDGVKSKSKSKKTYSHSPRKKKRKVFVVDKIAERTLSISVIN